MGAGFEPYLVVVGAVGAEIRLRTKHLVHHIQAAHGEEITESSGESCSAQLCSGRLETLIQPGKDSVALGRLRAAALRFYALDGVCAHWIEPGPLAATLPVLAPPSANQRPDVRLCLNELQLKK